MSKNLIKFLLKVMIASAVCAGFVLTGPEHATARLALMAYLLGVIVLL